MITPAQVRMARAALGWRAQDLADAAGVGISTILRFESERGGMQAETLGKVQAALQAQGVLFLEPGDMRDGGAGVRFKGK